jgi:hypothetical protein
MEFRAEEPAGLLGVSMPALRWPPIVYIASGVLAEQVDLHPDEALKCLVLQAQAARVPVVRLADEVAHRTTHLYEVRIIADNAHRSE